MPGRKYNSGSEYRYGFNGKELDKNISDGGQDYGERIYENRLGRWVSIDPEFNRYPSFTPYHMSINNPISLRDIDGRVLVDPLGNIIYEVDKNSKPFQVIYKNYPNYKIMVESVFIFSNKGEKISVQRFNVTNISTGAEISSSFVKQATNCHGHSSLNDKFRVDSKGGQANSILKDKAGLNQTDNLQSKIKKNLSQIKDGDIVALFNKDGIAIHSFIYVSKGIVSSKNGELGVNEFIDKNNKTYSNPKATVQDVVNLYSPREPGGVKVGFFTPVADKRLTLSQFFDTVGTLYITKVDATVEKIGIAPVYNYRNVPFHTRVVKNLIPIK